MELLKQIKKDRMVARKEGDTVKATLLTTLVGEADNILKGKQAKSFSTLALIKKFIKGLKDTAAAREKLGQKEFLTISEFKELTILESYLPKQYSITELEKVIDSQDLTQPMGQIMGYLKKNHGDKVDMKLAGQIIKKKQEKA